MRFLPRIFCALAGLVLVGCARPPEPVPPAPLGGAPALWRLSDENSTVWLFGSAHVLRPETRWLSPPVIAAVDGADVLVFELGVDPATAAQSRALFEQEGVNPPGVTLESLLPSDDAARLDRVVARLGLDRGALDRLRPWRAAQQIALTEALGAGARPEAGVEAVLAARAQARGIPIEALETPERQLRVLAGLPPAEEVAFLTATLRQIETEPTDLSVAEAAWAAGDLAQLEEILAAQAEAIGPQARRALLEERNAEWAPKVRAYLAREEDVFIAVGAAHLIGPGSLIALLEAQGLSVEQP